MSRLASEAPEHGPAIERVLARAFGPGRFAKTSERVREHGAVFEPGLSRVALDAEGQVRGCCRIWSVAVAGKPSYFLGPLAVDPQSQSLGLGVSLVRAAVDACRIAGGDAVILVGAAPFFQPLGFSVIPKGRVTLPGPVDPERLLWIALHPGGVDALSGALSAPLAAKLA
jgi:predicted N-acetyltransferase YhbS